MVTTETEQSILNQVFDRTNQSLRSDVTLNTPILPAAPFSFQVKVVVTGTAVAFPSNASTQGFVVTAWTGNSAAVVVGPSGINNTLDGTGTGSFLVAGQPTGVAAANTNTTYLNGTAGDWVSVIGS